MKTTKMIMIGIAALMINVSVHAQSIIEKTQDLSKNASKGFFSDAIINESTGNIEITYSYKGKSKDKDADAEYETYIFDKGLNFLKSEEIKINVQDKSPYTESYIHANVGGCTSFTILSMKLHLYKNTYEYTWNTKKRDFVGKRTEQVEIIPQNDDKRNYSGYDAFRYLADGKMMVLASSETKTDAGMKKEFVLLEVKTDLSTKEIALPIGPSQLVYSSWATNPSNVDESTTSRDMVFVFAPTFNKKNPVNYKQYTYLRVDKNGIVKENIKIDAPSANMVITGLGEMKDGSIYLCGSYLEEDKTFDQLFGEYSPLENSCYTGGTNYRMDKYESKTEGIKTDFFTILKIKDSKVEWIKNTPIDAISKLVKGAPKEKSPTAYKGNRLRIDYFNVSDNGDLFISGQLVGRIMMNSVSVKVSRDVICLQVSSTGEVKAQYGVEPKSIGDKQNTMFPIEQRFFDAGNNTMYWVMLETKAIKGYESFYDAYNGSPTYYPNYYPSVMKVNTATNQIMDYKLLGNRKFLLNKSIPYLVDKTNNSVIFIGGDKEKTLWLGKYDMSK